jgi:hypothetical protein
MIAVGLLEHSDILQHDDWCRPLRIVSRGGGYSDGYSFRCAYSGTPENNVKWVRVGAVIGPSWIGRPVGDYVSAMEGLGGSWEFLRGPVPESHQLDMTHYHDLSKRG